jgi:thioredoxin reductase
VPTNARKQIVVVGHGMAGHRFVQAAIERGLTERYDVVVVGEEPRAAYDRVALTSFFSAESADELSLLREGGYDDPRVRLLLNTQVVGIDRAARNVSLSDGQVLAYDELVLATGAAPFVPPVPGKDLDGCFVYRTIEDLEAIREASDSATAGIVIGGGLLGLEAANALVQLGLQTHVIEMAPRLMPVQLDGAGGAALVRHFEKLGVTVHAGVMIEQVLGLDKVTGLALTDDEPILAHVVVFSAGIRPRDHGRTRASPTHSPSAPHFRENLRNLGAVRLNRAHSGRRHPQMRAVLGGFWSSSHRLPVRAWVRRFLVASGEGSVDGVAYCLADSCGASAAGGRGRGWSCRVRPSRCRSGDVDHRLADERDRRRVGSRYWIDGAAAGPAGQASTQVRDVVAHCDDRYVDRYRHVRLHLQASDSGRVDGHGAGLCTEGVRLGNDPGCHRNRLQDHRNSSADPGHRRARERDAGHTDHNCWFLHPGSYRPVDRGAAAVRHDLDYCQNRRRGFDRKNQLHSQPAHGRGDEPEGDGPGCGWRPGHRVVAEDDCSDGNPSSPGHDTAADPHEPRRDWQ